MNEKQTQTPTLAPHVRPTKKQRELLGFIEVFIGEHGYSPSYREIMAGLGYTSVATVALHVRSLIQRGHLRKRDFSARSLELTTPTAAAPLPTNAIAPHEEKWLVDKVEYFFHKAEQTAVADEQIVASLDVLLAAMQVLGLQTAVLSFQPRLARLKHQPKQAVHA